MELLSPAGNLEKLDFVYKYGADAAYIGIKNFSLRYKADNFKSDEFEKIKEIKGDKKLYTALNIFFNNSDLKMLDENIEYLKNYPLDAFIVSDIGTLPFLQKHFPDKELHLSTQANCINKEAAKLYHNMGFSRVILGRETSLDEIKEIKDYVPELELETFVHGAMCLAYSGRCFLSREMVDRSANKGDCAHSCRWKYKIFEEKEYFLEEEKREGNYYPIYENDKYTTILSSKDLCLIDYLDKLVNAGIDSYKIEGRMKSIYYAAVVTRAYRKALDRVNGIEIKDFEKYREELFNVSHREFTTGFFFDKEDVQHTTKKTYKREYQFIGKVTKVIEEGLYQVELKNRLMKSDKIEYIGPDIIYIKDENFNIYDINNIELEKASHGKPILLKTDKNLKVGYIIRRKN